MNDLTIDRPDAASAVDPHVVLSADPTLRGRDEGSPGLQALPVAAIAVAALAACA